MHGFGYQDAVKIESREFRIHTGCEPEKQRILCEVFDEGRFVFSFSSAYNVRPEESESMQEVYLKDVTFDLHEAIREEVGVLFYAFSKLQDVKDAHPHYRLGKLFLHRNFYKEAVECFNNAIRLQPDFIRAYQKLTIAYLRMGQFKQAAAILKVVLRDHPDFPDLLDLLSIVYTNLGKYEEAKDLQQRVIKLKPDYLESQFNLGVVLFLSTLSDEDENIVIPARLLRMFHAIRKQAVYQDELWQARFTELEETLNTGQKKQVVAELLRFQIYFATSQDSSGYNLDLFLMKFMYGGKELDRDEMAIFEQKISAEAGKHANYADYWNELGIVHLIQCRDYFQSAVKEFSRAVEVNPRYADALRNLDMLKNNSKGFLILLRAILK